MSRKISERGKIDDHVFEKYLHTIGTSIIELNS